MSNRAVATSSNDANEGRDTSDPSSSSVSTEAGGSYWDHAARQSSEFLGTGNDTNEEDDEDNDNARVTVSSRPSSHNGSWMRNLHHAQLDGQLNSKHLLIGRLLRFREHFLSSDHFRTQLTAVAWQPSGRKQIIVGTAHGSLSVFHLNPSREPQHVHPDRVQRPVRSLIHRQSNTRLSANEQLIAHWPDSGRISRVCAIDYDPFQVNRFFTAGDLGRISHYDLITQTQICSHSVPPTNADEWEPRFITMRVHKSKQLVVAGDNKGQVFLLPVNQLGQNGSGQFHSIHAAHVSELDLHPSNENLLMTSSWDAKLKVWDIRRMTPDAPLQQFNFPRPLNSARFSLQPGHRVVTNDTQDSLYVFDGFPLRQFATLTHWHIQQQRSALLRARLHPQCADLLLVPFCNNAQSFCRASIDLLDIGTGLPIASIPVRPLIARSLIEFSSNGEMFASAYSSTLTIWTTPTQLE